MRRKKKTADQIEMELAQKLRRVKICDIPLRVKRADSKAEVSHWIGELGMWRSSFLSNWPERPGAPYLKHARVMASMVRAALAKDDAEAAAWAGMRLMDELWRAQTAEIQPIVKASVKRSRGAAQANTQRTADVEKERARFRIRADEIRKSSNRLMSKSEIAKIIDPARWKTIRKYI